MPPARRKLALAAAAIAVAAGTFVVLSPGAEDDGEPVRATTTSVVTPTTMTDTTSPAPPQTKAVVVVLRDGAPVGGVESIEVDSGERVRFDVRSDTPQEIHVHGFDLTENAVPGSRASGSRPTSRAASRSRRTRRRP
jgi:hypothetical protein